MSSLNEVIDTYLRCLRETCKDAYVAGTHYDKNIVHVHIVYGDTDEYSEVIKINIETMEVL